jgi:Zn-dependent peptidase ImmA (M78 family)
MDIKEIEANQFSAALLMPDTLVRAACGQWKGGLPDFEVARLATTFNVSEQAMTYRLNRLRLLWGLVAVGCGATTSLDNYWYSRLVGFEMVLGP